MKFSKLQPSNITEVTICILYSWRKGGGRRGIITRIAVKGSMFELSGDYTILRPYIAYLVDNSDNIVSLDMKGCIRHFARWQIHFSYPKGRINLLYL